jgi:hypothetical protein
VEIVDGGAVDLGFGLQASKCGRVKHTSSVTLKWASVVISANLVFIVVACFPLLGKQ